MNQKLPISWARRIFAPFSVIIAGAVVGFVQLIIGLNYMEKVPDLNPFALVFLYYPAAIAVMAVAGLFARGTRWQSRFNSAMVFFLAAEAAMVLLFMVMFRHIN